MEEKEITNQEDQKIDVVNSLESASVKKWKQKGGEKVFPVVFHEQNKQLLLDVVPSLKDSKNKYEIMAAALAGASGSLNTRFALTLLQGYCSTLSLKEHSASLYEASSAFLETMTALKPEDEIEGMLLTQIFSLQSMGMTCAARASHLENSPHHVDRNVNNMTKLIKLQHEAIEKLSRYRRKGAQQVVVQHVNVNDGGQAVVGGSFENKGEAPKL